jgi:hypothetical protein
MKSQYRARAESDELVYNELIRAARAGEKCPSNSKICALLGVSSVASASRIIRQLANEGRIVVKTYTTGREVHIPEIDLTMVSATFSRTVHPTVAPLAVSPSPLPRSHISREPCFRCGVRGDIGCEHTPEWARPTTAGTL